MKALSLLLLALLPQERAPVPDATAQKDAEKTIRDVFKDDFAKKSPADKRELAKKLLDQGVQTKEDPTSRFVLLREARDLAATLGDVETALRAVDTIAISHAIHAPDMKLAVLATVEKTAKAPTDLRNLATAYLGLANQAVQAEGFETADKAVTAAIQAAKKAKDTGLVARLEARSKEVIALKARFEKVNKARDTLAKDPQDPAANLEVGSWQCLYRDDWEGGLPLLGKGTESPLRGLAARDLAKPSAPTDCLSLADAWWDLATKEPAGPKESLRRRAASWYRKAAPGLTGLLKGKAEGRAVEVLAEPGKMSSWIDVNDPVAFGHKGKPGDPIELDGHNVNGKWVNLQKWPAGEFDGITVRMRFKGEERKGFAILTYAPKCEFSFLSYSCDANRMTETNAPLDHTAGPRGEPKEVRVATVLLIDSQFIFYADGTEFGRMKSPVDTFTSLELRALGGTIAFDRVRLRKRE